MGWTAHFKKIELREGLGEVLRKMLSLEEVQTAEKWLTNPHTFSLPSPVHPRVQKFTESSERSGKGV